MVEEIKKHQPDSGRIQCDVWRSISLELFGHITCTGHFQGKNHCHPFWELIYVTGGQGIFRYGRHSYRVSKGDFFLFKPHFQHQFSNTSPTPYSNLYIGFSFQQIPEPLMKKQIPFYLNRQPGSETLRGKLTSLCNHANVTEELLQAKLPTALEIILHMTSLLTDAGKPASALETKMAIVSKRIQEFLTANIRRSVTAREVTNLFYNSPHYVADLFKESSGLSIKEYHHALRMEEAHRLLRNTNLSITEIADHLGFDNLHYFSRRFKQYYKLAPRALRQKR